MSDKKQAWPKTPSPPPGYLDREYFKARPFTLLLSNGESFDYNSPDSMVVDITFRACAITRDTMLCIETRIRDIDPKVPSQPWINSVELYNPAMIAGVFTTDPEPEPGPEPSEPQEPTGTQGKRDPDGEGGIDPSRPNASTGTMWA